MTKIRSYGYMDALIDMYMSICICTYSWSSKTNITVELTWVTSLTLGVTKRGWTENPLTQWRLIAGNIIERYTGYVR